MVRNGNVWYGPDSAEHTSIYFTVKHCFFFLFYFLLYSKFQSILALSSTLPEQRDRRVLQWVFWYYAMVFPEELKEP